MKRKNAFGMLGSWIGFAVGILLSVTVLRGYDVFLGLPRLFPCNSAIPGGCWTATAYSNLVYVPIIGFLVGWVINLLVRKHK